MEISVSQVKIKGGTLGFSFETKGKNSLLPQGLKFVSSVKVEGDAQIAENDVVVSGCLTAKYLAQCSRCLKPLELVLDVDFNEVFKRNPALLENADGNRDDGEIRYFGGDEISLDKLVDDIILLNVQRYPLCKQDCKGLCNVCGADLNEGECDCLSPEEEASPFAVLKKAMLAEEKKKNSK